MMDKINYRRVLSSFHFVRSCWWGIAGDQFMQQVCDPYELQSRSRFHLKPPHHQGISSVFRERGRVNVTQASI